jgi:hypothetical protein
VDSNVTETQLSGPSSSFKFAQAGAQLLVYNAGGTLLDTLNIANNVAQTLTFTDGSTTVTRSGAAMQVAGTLVTGTSSNPAAVTATTALNSAHTTPSTVAQGTGNASIYLGNSDSFASVNNNETIYGGAGTGTVTLAAGVTGVTEDSNVTETQLSGASASFKYAQAGAQLLVYNAAGTLLNTLNIANNIAQTLTFTDGSTTTTRSGAAMQVAGTLVTGTSSNPTSLTVTSSLDTTHKTPTIGTSGQVAITAAGTESGAAGNVTFNVAAGSYSNTINNFVAGDSVVMPAGVQATVVNTSFTDGTVTLQWASGGQTVNIVLTGLTNAQDQAAAFHAGSNTFTVSAAASTIPVTIALGNAVGSASMSAFAYGLTPILNNPYTGFNLVRDGVQTTLSFSSADLAALNNATTGGTQAELTTAINDAVAVFNTSAGAHVVITSNPTGNTYAATDGTPRTDGSYTLTETGHALTVPVTGGWVAAGGVAATNSFQASYTAGAAVATPVTTALTLALGNAASSASMSVFAYAVNPILNNPYTGFSLVRDGVQATLSFSSADLAALNSATTGGTQAELTAAINDAVAAFNTSAGAHIAITSNPTGNQYTAADGTPRTDGSYTLTEAGHALTPGVWLVGTQGSSGFQAYMASA